MAENGTGEARMLRALIPYAGWLVAAGSGVFSIGSVVGDSKDHPIDLAAIAKASGDAAAIQAENAVLKIQAGMNTTLGGLIAKVDNLQTMTDQVTEQSRAIVYLQRSQEQGEQKDKEQDARLDRIEGGG